MSSAKARLTRMSKEHFNQKIGIPADHPFHKVEDPIFTYAIAEENHYYDKVEKQVKKTNLMSGQEFYESVNTPYYCSPSSETYWSS